MPPIKFEEHLRETLEKRKIQPSLEAWDALAMRLNAHEKKQYSRTVWWIGVAASIVGVLLVTSLIFERSGLETKSPVIVDVPNEDKPQQNVVVMEEISPEARTNEVHPTPQIESYVPIRSKIKTREAIEALVSNPRVLKESIVYGDPIKGFQQTETNEVPLETSEFEQFKLNEVIAGIYKINATNLVVTEAEIDSLLKQAEREILMNRIHNNATKTVDAKTLLQDVEADLEQSFRTKVLETLVNNYEIVKTAVANRNN